MMHDDLSEVMSKRKDVPFVADMIKSAQVFYTDFKYLDDQNLITSAYEFFKEGILPLPYSNCLFVIEDAFENGCPIIALVTDEEHMTGPIPDHNGMKARLSITLFTKHEDQFYMPATMGIFDVFSEKNTPLCKVLHFGENVDEPMRQTLRDALAFCMILNTKYFDKKETVIDDKLNRARAKRGKPPLKNSIRVFLSKSATSETGQMSGSHKSPIPHWRRGHIRRYDDGKITTVRPTIVNFEGKVPEKREYKIA